MDVTLAICTRNRAPSLRQTLAGLARLAIPPGLQWECIIIDNGSTDDTAAAVASFQGVLPLRYCLEPVAGISHARNRGMAEARGRYMCWTDDDVDVPADWLAAYVRAFAAHPDAAFFGGPIVPHFESEPPAWFARNLNALASLTARRDFGPASLVFDRTSRELPYGANFAVLTDANRRHPYDLGMGAAPARDRTGEETDVLLAICADGGFGVWVPDAPVRHRIPPGRMTPAYVQAYERSVGETWAYLSVVGRPNFIGEPIRYGGRTIRGVPPWILRKAFKHRLLAWLASVGAPGVDWLYHWRRYAFFQGAANFSRRRAGTDGRHRSVC